MNERISLITSICSDPDEAKLFEYLSKDDAQAFVDVVDEVSILSRETVSGYWSSHSMSDRL